MKKRIIVAVMSIIIVLSLIVFVPDSDAGTSTLNVTNSTYNVEAGKSFRIKLNGIKASKVKWSSNKKSIATVSKKGVVSGVQKGNATITGKYKNLKFKIKVTVNKKGQSTYNYKDMEVKFKDAKMSKDDYGDKCWAITFTYKNKGAAPCCFYDTFIYEAYINDVETDDYSTNNAGTNIKNGASIDVTFYYKVKTGDKLDFFLMTYDDNYDKVVIYEYTKEFK